jgi:hypothetical protein
METKDLSPKAPFAALFAEAISPKPPVEGFTTFETRNDGIEEADVDADKNRCI